MSGVYLGRGSAPSDGTGIGSVITQHVGIHLLLQLIAGGKAAVRKNTLTTPSGRPALQVIVFF